MYCRPNVAVAVLSSCERTYWSMEREEKNSGPTDTLIQGVGRRLSELNSP